MKSYYSHLISLILHGDKREQSCSLKSFWHFLDDSRLFLKGYHIILSIDYHPKAFSFFYFFAFNICRRTVDIQSEFSSLYFVRDNVCMLKTIPQSFAYRQHNTHYYVIIAHFNNFKSDFGSTCERYPVKRSYMVINIFLLFEFYFSISNLKIIDILSYCKRFKNVLIKPL